MTKIRLVRTGSLSLRARSPTRLPSHVVVTEEEFPLITTDQVIPALAFMTLGIVIAFAIFQFFSIMRRRRERQQTPLTQASELKRARQGSVIEK